MTTRQLISTSCTSGGITIAAYASACIIFSIIGVLAAPNQQAQHKAVDLMALSFGGIAVSSALITTGALIDDI